MTKQQISQLDHLNLTVADFEKSREWYGKVFGFETVENGRIDGRPWGVLQAGSAHLCIYESKERSFFNRFNLADRRQHGMNHFALRVVDRKQWESLVDELELDVLYGGPVNWPHSTSWYIKDPTGYEIEVVAWDKDKPRFD